jgi:cell wall assembly regulator SMI1
MKDLKMEKPRSPLRREDITRVERQLGVIFPEDYRRFLLRYNGGRPKPDLFRIEAAGPEWDDIMNWFYCINPGDMYGLVENNDELLRSRMPPELIAIGDDPLGNQICIAVKGSKKGSVYFWDHENEAPDGEEPWWENVYLLADTFEKFVDSLYGDSTVDEDDV